MNDMLRGGRRKPQGYPGGARCLRLRRKPDLSDEALLDLVQKQTFRYFWDFAHLTSGLARTQQSGVRLRPEVVTTGGSGSAS